MVQAESTNSTIEVNRSQAVHPEDMDELNLRVQGIHEQAFIASPSVDGTNKPIDGIELSDTFRDADVSLTAEDADSIYPYSDWLTVRGVCNAFGVGPIVIRRIVDQCRDRFPDGILDLRTKQGKGKSAEHYAPEVVDRIRAEIEKITAPEGWQPVKTLAEDLGCTSEIIYALKDEWEKTHTDESQMHCIHHELLTNHYRGKYYQHLLLLTIHRHL